MMHETTDPSSNAQAEEQGFSPAQKPKKHMASRIVRYILWVIGLAIILTSAVIIRGHPDPWPFEVSFSRSIQALNLNEGFVSVLTFLAGMINPVPSAITLLAWLAFLLIFNWYKQAGFLVLTISIGNAIDALIGDFVHRPRPSHHYLARIEGLFTANSFPSGHCAHTILYYGALLYLSFSGSVRRWRYRWLLIPLQIFAALNILVIGFERIYQGEHWLTDVLGGTLDGFLWLCAGIFVYHRVEKMLEKRRARKEAEAQYTPRAISA